MGLLPGRRVSVVAAWTVAANHDWLATRFEDYPGKGKIFLDGATTVNRAEFIRASSSSVVPIPAAVLVTAGLNEFIFYCSRISKTCAKYRQWCVRLSNLVRRQYVP
jgi:hypothetical protein